MDTEKIGLDTQLEHMLEEWKYLNDYINGIDTGYQNSMLLLLTIFTALIGFFTESDNKWVKYCVLLIPLGIEAILAYVSYQFRIVAIIRGHLASLEVEMNKLMKNEIHSWNSALVEMYMARNNLINKFMMIPICFLIITIGVFCFCILLEIVCTNIISICLFIVYWVVVIAFAAIILIPFFKNEKVREKTFCRKEVWKQYSKLKKLK